MTAFAERQVAAGDERALAALARDAAFARIGRARRWLLLGAVAMTAGLAALASSLLPGKSLGSAGAHGRLRTGVTQGSGARTQGAAAPSAAAPALPAPAGAAQLGLQGPVQAPQSSPPASSQSAPPATQSSPPPASAPAPAPAPSAPASGGVVSGGS
jgi:hypothetical protein